MRRFGLPGGLALVILNKISSCFANRGTGQGWWQLWAQGDTQRGVRTSPEEQRQ